MKIPDFSSLIKRLAGFIPRYDIEKVIFKTLLAIWLLVIVAAIVLRATFGARDDIEEKIIEAAVGAKSSVKEKSDMGHYEALLALAKHPEGIEEYSSKTRRDPFSEYKGIIAKPSTRRKYDFVLKSVDRIPLPMVYKGYIELPDKIIGQINWRETTRFVEAGSTLNGYKIRNISKGSIDAINTKGENLEFKLNKPVLGDELQATLYDKISKETFDVQLSSEIGGYKVVDIAPNHVILVRKGQEIKLGI